MAGKEITVVLDRDSEAALAAWAEEEGVSVEYTATLVVTRHLNNFAQGLLDRDRPSKGRRVET